MYVLILVRESISSVRSPKYILNDRPFFDIEIYRTPLWFETTRQLRRGGSTETGYNGETKEAARHRLYLDRIKMPEAFDALDINLERDKRIAVTSDTADR